MALNPDYRRIRPELLNMGLLGGPQAAAQPAAPPVAPVAPRGRLAGVGSALAQIFGGQNDPRLNEMQNTEAGRQARLIAGLQGILASQRPGASALEAIATGALTGQQAGAQGREGIYQQGVQQDRNAKMKALVDSGAVDAASLKQMFGQSLASGDMESAKAIAEVLKVMENRNGATQDTGAYMIKDEGINPETDKPEKFLQDRRTGEIKWTGVAPVPPAGPMRLTIDQRSRENMSEAMQAQYGKAITAAESAFDRLDTLSTMEGLLKNTPTGGLEELTLPWRNLAASFGIESENVGRQQVFVGLANKIALEMKGNMTGQMSDRDIIFLQRQAPQLANTPEGNKLMIEILRRFAEKQIALADEMDRFYEEKGTLAGWRTHRSRWARENQVDLSDINQRAPWGS